MNLSIVGTATMTRFMDVVVALVRLFSHLTIVANTFSKDIQRMNGKLFGVKPLFLCMCLVGDRISKLMMIGYSLAQRPLCAVDCSHYGSVLTNLADDPFDCHSYYVCTSPTAYVGDPVSCPEGEAFDTNTKKCMDPSVPGFNCTYPCEKCTFDCVQSVMGKSANRMYGLEYYECDKYGNIKATIKCDPKTPYFDGQKCQTDIHLTCSCRPPECSQDDVLFNELKPDYFNCTNFYHCYFKGLPDETSLDKCPLGQIFSRVDHKCDYKAKCSAPCSDYEQY